MSAAFDEIRRQGIHLVTEFDREFFDRWVMEVEKDWPSWNRLERRSLRTILSLLRRLFGDLLEKDAELILPPPEMIG